MNESESDNLCDSSPSEYLNGHIVEFESELVGMSKGMDQYISERNIDFDKSPCKQKAHIANEYSKSKKARLDYVKNKASKEARRAMLEVKPKDVVIYESEQLPCSCRCCTLRRQPDFLSQQNGAYEAITSYNEVNETNHCCKFLTKFHPELNPIERVWSRMKWFIR